MAKIKCLPINSHTCSPANTSLGSGSLQCLPPLLGLDNILFLLKPSLELDSTGGLSLWMTHQETIEASTHIGSGASLLLHQLDRIPLLVDALQIYARFQLLVIPSTNIYLHDLGMLDYIMSCLFKADNR